MTTNEKEEIVKLRKTGLGYKAIAAKLSLTPSAVRYVIQKSEEDQSGLVCKNCGMKLKQTKGHRQKIFCSLKCKNAWWYKNPDKRELQAYHECCCLSCGKEFISYSKSDRKYCSQECYQKSRGVKDENN